MVPGNSRATTPARSSACPAQTNAGEKPTPALADLGGRQPASSRHGRRVQVVALKVGGSSPLGHPNRPRSERCGADHDYIESPERATSGNTPARSALGWPGDCSPMDHSCAVAAIASLML
jgi:hypothetical protein